MKQKKQKKKREKKKTRERKKKGLLQLVAEWIRRVLRHALGFWHTEGWRGDSFRCRAGRRNSKKASKLKRQSKAEENTPEKRWAKQTLFFGAVTGNDTHSGRIWKGRGSNPTDV